MDNAKPAPEVFISYSRKDEKFRGELETHLKGLSLHSDQAVDWWSDARLIPGGLWRDELFAALGSCRIALLLVSKNFLASDFIAKEELPLIFDRVNRGDGLTIFWVLLSPCYWEYTPISQYTALYKEEKFAGMYEHTRDAIWTDIIKKIREQLDKPPEKIPRLQKDGDPFWDYGQRIPLDLGFLRSWFNSYETSKPNVDQACILALQAIITRCFADENPLILNWDAPEPHDLQIGDENITAWIDFEKLTARLYPRFRDAHLALLLHKKSMDNFDSGENQQADRYHLKRILRGLLRKQMDYDRKLDALAILGENQEDFEGFCRHHSALPFSHLAILWAVETKVFTENNGKNERLHWLFLSTRLCERVCHWLLQAHAVARQSIQSHHNILTTDNSSLSRRPEGS
jgi:TIR domain